MTTPAEYNFSLYIGQTLKQPFTVWNDEAQTSPYSFTGHTIRSQIRLSYNSTQALTLTTTVVGNTIYLNATPEAMRAFFVIQNAQSAKYYYDVEITKPDLSVWTLVRGVIDVYPEVTKI